MRFYRNMVFDRIENQEFVNENYEVATYSGVTKKTLFYLMMVVLGAFGGFALGAVNEALYVGILAASGLLTFIFAMIAMLSPRSAKVAGSLYCLFEGCVVGFISMAYSTLLEGAVLTALLSTTMVFFVVATLFLSNIVKVNSKFMRFLLIFAISFIVTQLVLYLIMAISGQEYSITLCLGISAITVFLASLYLLFDLEHIRMTVEGGYPKEYEWYASFGLTFTLVWLYVEILRLIVIIFTDRN